MSVRLALAALVLCGCSDALDWGRPPEPSYERYLREIEPELVTRCGNPSGCHGREDRPYALYVRRANRVDPADVFLDPALSEAESRANYYRTISFAAPLGGTAPLILSKPLARSAGGANHRGGAIYESESQRGYRLLADWLEEGER